jgi:SecD/SecF fusion protein
MKRILFLIISIVIFITLISAVNKGSGNTKTITLQATGNNCSSATLNQSADIISVRLKQIGLKSFDINVLADKDQISVQLSDTIDISEIQELLTSKGQLAFYETYTHKEIKDLFKPGDKLFELLNSNLGKNQEDPRVGCVDSEKMDKADEYLQLLNLPKKCKLLWSVESEKSDYCLFALKTDEEGNPLLGRSDIESVKIAMMKDSKEPKIQIKLKPSATGIFADATKKNLNKAIAIVIDNQVYSWPVVRNVIDSGEIEVSGNFTEKQVNYYPVLFNSEQLPLSLKILK